MSDREIYNAQEWAMRRERYRYYRSWYEGKPLGETMKRRDRREGGDVRKFPLGINLTKLGCDVHTDFARGLKSTDDPLVVRAAIDRGDDPDTVEKFEEILNEYIWEPSRGGAIQQESILEMNIYGGTVLQITWEPWNFDLPYRMAVRLIKDPSSINPVWNARDPWRIPECYIGYTITHGEARAVYNITPRSETDPPLYMEHWTKDSWSVRIDDQVPTMEWDDRTWALEGKNPWGFVPVYYIPHQRTTSLFGNGEIGDEDLVKEFNARAANMSDIVMAAWPGMLWGRDFETNPKIQPVMSGGHMLLRVINLGRTRGAPGAQPPELKALPVPDIPDAVSDWQQELISYFQMTRRLSPAVFGMDDTQSGRITGPAVGARMVSSTNHAGTERINYTTGKTLIDRDIIRVFNERVLSGAFSELGIEADSFPIDPARVGIRQKWPPILPLDRTADHEEWMERLKEGGTSLREFLRTRGVDDIEGEMKLIWEELEKRAEIEGMAKPEPFGGGGDGARN